MSNLKAYIEKVKEYKRQNPNLSEDMLIRYVYLDLGQRFSFDLKFSFGNSKIKQRIYAKGKNEEELNDSMQSNIVICKSVSYILEYILKNLGVNIITVVDQEDERKCPHMYNVIIPKEGNRYSVDLQEDMENIQSHSFTKNYGLAVDENKLPVIKRFDIEQMDRKLGFIDDEHYYADDYLYLLKSDIGNFTDFSEKVKFVLENIDIHENKNMHYAERKWHHKKILQELFQKEELRKIHMIDCYQVVKENREYINCIAVDHAGSSDIYIYSIEENRYCKMTIQEFAKLTKNGLVHLQEILGLRKALKDLKAEKDERIEL